jgi:hypothetical protein
MGRCRPVFTGTVATNGSSDGKHTRRSDGGDRAELAVCEATIGSARELSTHQRRTSVVKDPNRISKNQRAGERGAKAVLTPHVCPLCNQGVPENQLLVVLEYNGSKRRRTRGYHRGCYRLAS